MKKLTLVILISVLSLSRAYAVDRAKDVNQIFYKANSLYDKGDYAKAVEDYINILDMGLKSGNLYYNIGNGFLKLGKIGYAILCYEKAKKFIPGDSDLKSNLNYAKGLIEDTNAQAPPQNFIIRIIERPFKDFNLDTVCLFAVIFYIIVITVSSISILNPIFGRKVKFLLLAILVIFLLNLTTFVVRLFEEEILKHGIVVQTEVECKYEPIDKSTTYYKLHEGNEVLILETRNGWRQIKRLDGKIAWAKKEAVEGI